LHFKLQERNLPEGIVKYVLQQIAKVLPNDAAGRHDFVTSGGFAKVQQLDQVCWHQPIGHR
jgi:hypothetical protein